LDIQKKVEIFSNFFIVRNAYGTEQKKNPGVYFPACGNFLAEVCKKKTDFKAKCAGCEHKSFKPISKAVVAEHVSGKEIHQFYLLRENNTIRVGAVDFDNKAKSSRERQYPFSDIVPFCNFLKRLSIPYLLTRSSYSGHHLYVFFSDDVPAHWWHALCNAGFKESGYTERDTYPSCAPEIFPKQMTLAAGGNGNGITLPMIEPRIKNGHSCIVGEDGEPVADQWSSLEKIFKVPNSYLKKKLDSEGIDVKATPLTQSQEKLTSTNYEAPLKGDTNKVIAGCEAFKKLDDKFSTGYVPGHDEGMALFHTLMHTQNGREYFRNKVPGWADTDEQIQELEYSLQKNYKPYSCDVLKGKGVCHKQGECFTPLPPFKLVDGSKVYDFAAPREKWSKPSPIRYANGGGNELFGHAIKALEGIAEEKNEEKRCKDFEDLLSRIQFLGDHKLSIIYEKAKSLKILKPRQVNEKVKDAQETQVESLKKSLEERTDKVHVQGCDYLKRFGGGYLMIKFVRNKAVEVPLSDCDIRITNINRYIAEANKDDVRFEGYAQHKNQRFDFEISSKHWHDNSEFFTFFGTLLVGRFNILKKNCDHLRQAALAFSQLEGIDEQTYYTDPGWRNGKFIMPSLVIDKDGITENTEYPVMIPKESHDFASQIDFDFSSEIEHKELLQHIVNDFSNCWPRSWTLPSLSHTLLPVLLPLYKIEGDPRPSLVLEGKSGSGKTELAKFLQRFYGNFNSFIGVTGSTSNGLRAFCHAFKDCLMVVDDYKNLDERERKAVLDLVQSTYNQARNVKLNRDSTIKATLTARAVPLITGEQFIDGHSSVIGRSIIIETHHHNTNDTIEMYEKVCERKGQYNTILPRFIQWAMSLDWVEIRSKVMRAKRTLYADVKGKDNADRIALNLAINETTLHLFSDYCVVKGAITEDEGEELKQEHTKIVKDILEEMCHRIKEENSSEQFVDHLRELVVRNEAVIKGVNEIEAERKPIIGFLKHDINSGPVVMLFPKSIMEITSKHSSNKAAHFRHTQRSLGRELHDRAMLSSVSEPNRLTTRTYFNGHRIRCWPLKPDALGLDMDALMGHKRDLRVASSPEDII
jgi:hypothetical protein